ncbi:MAG: hypothetical protein IJ869_02715 [Clostridiales bacterium]|nr:hypothetical protein [Clostridiales bacterium]
MGKESRYDNITVLEVEISSFSGGGYKVKYDFKKKLISWNDGYMWNNNFMKSLTESKLELIRERLPESGMIEWMEAYNSGRTEEVGNPTANPSSWKIVIRFEDDTTLISSHTKNFPKDWYKLKSIIEETTECRFRLR